MMTYQEILSFAEYANEAADEELNKYGSALAAKTILFFASNVLDHEVSKSDSTPAGWPIPLTKDECESITNLSDELLTKSRKIGIAEE